MVCEPCPEWKEEVPSLVQTYDSRGTLRNREKRLYRQESRLARRRNGTDNHSKEKGILDEVLVEPKI